MAPRRGVVSFVTYLPIARMTQALGSEALVCP